MSTSPGPGPLGRLTRLLVDDAAVFPPGNAPLGQAVAEHRGHRAAPYADQVGPLLVRAADATRAAALLRPGERLPVALVVRPGTDPALLPGAAEALRGEDRALLTGVELPVAGAEPLGPVRDLGVPIWLEVSARSLAADLDEVLGAGARAKLRTGGLIPAEVPDDLVVATFVVGCARRGLGFKLTAGLHHAVRGVAAGLEHHGVANVLLGTVLALDGAEAEAVAAVLAERRPAVLRDGLIELDEAAAIAVRRAFVSFGCCGVPEPIGELAAMLDPGPSRTPPEENP
jgi:hypothetical protein